MISKVIASAVANGGYDAQDVFVTSCRVDTGPVLRRFMPRAKGRATPIRKPTAHILVEVGTQQPQTKRAKSKVSQPNIEGIGSDKDLKAVSTKKARVKKKTEGEGK